MNEVNIDGIAKKYFLVTMLMWPYWQYFLKFIA